MAQAEPYALAVPWDEAERWLGEVWEPGQHCSIYGRSGMGKSYLFRYGLAPIWHRRRQRGLVLDTKHDRGTLRDMGHVTGQYPAWSDSLPFRVREWTVGEQARSWQTDPEWYKLQPPHPGISAGPRLERAKRIVRQALDRVFREGHWVLGIDETQTVTRKAPPGYDLGSEMQTIWQEGRDREITVIAGSQVPVDVPSAMHDQPTLACIGRVTDHRRLERLGEITGQPELVEGIVPELEGKEFLIIHLEREEWLITEVKVAA